MGRATVPPEMPGGPSVSSGFWETLGITPGLQGAASLPVSAPPSRGFSCVRVSLLLFQSPLRHI